MDKTKKPIDEKLKSKKNKALTDLKEKIEYLKGRLVIIEKNSNEVSYYLILYNAQSYYIAFRGKNERFIR